MAIMALAVAGVSFALRDSSHSALERDAQRLIAQLESGRALARTTGQTLHWRAHEGGYSFDGPATRNTRQAWLTPAVEVQWPANLPAPAQALLLGPEPLLPAQTITLRLANTSLRIASDGLRPFAVEAQP